MQEGADAIVIATSYDGLNRRGLRSAIGGPLLSVAEAALYFVLPFAAISAVARGNGTAAVIVFSVAAAILLFVVSGRGRVRRLGATTFHLFAHGVRIETQNRVREFDWTELSCELSPLGLILNAGLSRRWLLPSDHVDPRLFSTARFVARSNATAQHRLQPATIAFSLSVLLTTIVGIV